MHAFPSHCCFDIFAVVSCLSLSLSIFFCLFDHARPGRLSNKLDLVMVFVSEKKGPYYFSVCFVLYLTDRPVLARKQASERAKVRSRYSKPVRREKVKTDRKIFLSLMHLNLHQWEAAFSQRCSLRQCQERSAVLHFHTTTGLRSQH